MLYEVITFMKCTDWLKRLFNIKDSQIGIIGNNATVRDINIYPPDKESPAETRNIYLIV